MYKLEFLKATRKDFKKLSAQARDFIINQVLPKIAKNPHDHGILLHGELRSYWKHTISFRGTNYRIVYQIDNQEKVILVIAVGSREGFYDRLLRRLGL